MRVSQPQPLASVVVRGITLVAPPRPFETDPFTSLADIQSNWVAVVPYGFMQAESPEVVFDAERQWWGERTEGTLETIRLAKSQGLRVMLKPQVWRRGLWTGDVAFDDATDRLDWEQSYRAFILHFAKLAQRSGVDLFCVGTEFGKTMTHHRDFWSDLIRQVRIHYPGALTYAANWDEFEHTPFWSELDYIGVNAYFPLSKAATPTVEQLVKAWRGPRQSIQKISQMYDRPVLFTEYGYLSVDGCSHNTWELEKKLGDLSVNEDAQANALEALHATFSREPWWSGGFLWKWYANPSALQERLARDYTPQGKLAEQTLQKWFLLQGR